MSPRRRSNADRPEDPLQRELASVYAKLELPECKRLFATEQRGDPDACREIQSAIEDARDEQRSWAEDARAERGTVDELENEIRESPESRAAAEPDLNSSKRLLKESEGEVRKAEGDLEQLDAEAREEGCAV